MKERPENWEVVCERCLAGLVMSDGEVTRRLDSKNNYALWPKHCEKSMSLRHIVSEQKQDCSHTGCWHATNRFCSCLCGGRNHGVMNPNPEYSSVKVVEPAWYRKPIRELITI